MSNNRADSSKDKILKSALEEFADRGLAGARIDRIAAAAGVNKAMIYYYFASKQELYQKAVVEHVAARFRLLRESVDSKQHDLASVAKVMADTYAQILRDSIHLRKVLLRELADPDSEIVPIIATVLRDSGLARSLVEILNSGAHSGALRSVDPVHSVISFISMNVGYFLLSPVMNRVLGIKNPDEFIDSRKEPVVDLFLNGVVQK